MQILIFTFTVVLTGVRCNVAYWNQFGQLQPVQGVYVKPSSDGTTGDLYIAASENNPQWLNEQPLNFLPVGAQQNTLPVTFAGGAPHDGTVSVTHKRAVFNPSTYSYAIPTISNDGAAAAYTFPTSASTPSEVAPPKCSAEKQALATLPAFPYPFQYFYPHMASLMSGAVNAGKEVNANVEGATVAAQPSQLWPPNALPIQYLMMDPSTWAQAQTVNVPATSSADKA